MKRKIFIFLLLIYLIPGCTRVTYPVLNNINTETYPDAHGIIVFDSLTININRDGTGENIQHSLIKILTSHGINKYSDFSFSYLSTYDTLIVKKAVVIKPDGKIVKVSGKDIEDVPMPAYQGAKFVIPNLRILKIKFPGIEKGASVEYIVERITKNAPIDSTFNYWDIFQDTDPILTKSIIVKFPSTMKPQWKVVNGEIKHDSIISDNTLIHRWWVNNQKAIQSEPMMPMITDVAPKLLITTIPSWEYVSKWYYNLCEIKLKNDSLVKEELKNILKDKNTDREKIKAIFNYIITNIRYVETKLIGKKGGYEPQNPDFTLKNKFGVCRDKAFLMVSMLRDAGFKNSYMVLTNPVIKVEDFPAPSQFNHAIVALKTDTGWIYFDPTVENTMEFLPPTEDGKQILISTKEGETLKNLPERPLEEIKTEVTSYTTIDKDGNAKMITTTKGKGNTDIGIRTLVRLFPENKLKEILSTSVKRSYPSAVIDSIKTKNIEDLTKPAELTIYFTIPDFVTRIGKEWHLTSNSQEKSWQAFSLSERKYPLYLWTRSYSVRKNTIEFPSFLKVKQTGENIEKETKDIYFSKVVKKEKNKIMIRTEITIKNVEIPVERYKENKTLIDRIIEESKKDIVLEEK